MFAYHYRDYIESSNMSARWKPNIWTDEQKGYAYKRQSICSQGPQFIRTHLAKFPSGIDALIEQVRKKENDIWLTITR